MNTIYPIARRDYHRLIVNKDDLPFIGGKRALEVMCIQADLKNAVIDSDSIELEKHLKFNPWEEIVEEDRDAALQELQSVFSNEAILEKIVKPLAMHVVKL